MNIKDIGGTILAMGVIIFLTLGLCSLEQGAFKLFSPRHKPSDKLIQELDKMRLEYTETTDPKIRRDIEIRALQLTAEFKENEIPTELCDWTKQMKPEPQEKSD